MEIKEVSNRIKTELDFIDINNKIHQFNPLKVLGVEEREIRHSKILAWLLDAEGNHNLGNIFLKEFIKRIYLNHPNEMPLILDTNLDDLIIKTEWNNKTDKTVQTLENFTEENELGKDRIDIVAVSSKHKFVLIIENKINAKAASGQLKRYKEMILSKYPSYSYLPIFLTILGDLAPEEESWYKTFSHQDIYLILKDLLKKELTIKFNQISLQNKIMNFISDYMDVLEELTFPSEDTVNKCLKIYKENKDVIDNYESHLDFFTSSELKTLEVIRNTVKALPFITFQIASEQFKLKFTNVVSGNHSQIMNEIITDERFYKSGKEFWFLPAAVHYQIDNKLLSNKWKSPFPIAYFFQLKNSTLSLNVELGPIDIKEGLGTKYSREKIIQLIKENPNGEFDAINPTRAGTKKWVKIFSINEEKAEINNQNELLKQMTDLYLKSNEAGKAIFSLVCDLNSDY